MKKATIIIINYNDKIRIKRAIESAINQTWKNTEVIVVDDGSDDETRDIYKEYKNQVFLIQLERDDKALRTPSRARNAGMEKAQGDYVAFLDSDNYYEYTFLEECLKHDNEVMFVNWDIIGNENYSVNIENVWDFKKSLLQNYLQFQHLDHQCLLTKRNLLCKIYRDKAKPYDLRLPRSQDCDLIVRLLNADCEWRHVTKHLFRFEKHESDQMKSVASIHGKTLWSLKNNINIVWLLQLINNDPLKLLSIIQGIVDFSTLPEWNKDFKESEFNGLMDKFNKHLKNEKSEKIL